MIIEENTVCYTSEIGHNNFLYPTTNKVMVKENCEVSSPAWLGGGNKIPIKILKSKLKVTTSFGTNIIESLRAGGFLDDYERGSYGFSDYISKAIRQNFYDLDFIESSIEKYDYKRGFCTLSAKVKIPVEDLIMKSPYVGGWTVSVPTENGTITLN